MTPKQYLMRYQSLNRHIDSLLREHDRIKLLATSAQSLDYSKERVQTSYRGSQVENTAYKLIELEARINHDIDRLVDLRDEVCAVIDAVSNDTYRLLLRLRYIEGLKWDGIATRMKYEERQIYRFHGYALQNITVPQTCQ